MTLAIGQGFSSGIIVAADTQLTTSLGKILKESKINAVLGSSGQFILALSSDDFESTKTLSNHILQKLEFSAIDNVEQLEDIVTLEMTKWHGRYGKRTPPGSAFILAARLKDEVCRLFRFSPPATFLGIEEQYASIGCGSDIADPLHDTLFGFSDKTLAFVHAMRNLCYLFYRAKEGDALVGHRTLCMILQSKSKDIIKINAFDVAEQERASSALDFILQYVTNLTFGAKDGIDDKVAEQTLKLIDGSKDLRKVVFHDYGMEEINV